MRFNEEKIAKNQEELHRIMGGMSDDEVRAINACMLAIEEEGVAFAQWALQFQDGKEMTEEDFSYMAKKEETMQNLYEIIKMSTGINLLDGVIEEDEDNLS